ncbi:MAG: protein YgfX [Pseudomonadales bacterium]
MFPVQTLYVVIRPSWRYAALLIGVHLLGLLALPFAPLLGLPLKLALGFALLLSCWHSLQKQALLTSDDAVVRLTWSDKEYFLTTAGGQMVRARLDTRVTFPWLLILNFKEATSGHWLTNWLHRRTWSVVILPDMVPPTTLRRLQVFFRWAN